MRTSTSNPIRFEAVAAPCCPSDQLLPFFAIHWLHPVLSSASSLTGLTGSVATPPLFVSNPRNPPVTVTVLLVCGNFLGRQSHVKCSSEPRRGSVQSLITPSLLPAAGSSCLPFHHLSTPTLAILDPSFSSSDLPSVFLPLNARSRQTSKSPKRPNSLLCRCRQEDPGRLFVITITTTFLLSHLSKKEARTRYLVTKSEELNERPHQSIGSSPTRVISPRPLPYTSIAVLVGRVLRCLASVSNTFYHRLVIAAPFPSFSPDACPGLCFDCELHGWPRKQPVPSCNLGGLFGFYHRECLFW